MPIVETIPRIIFRPLITKDEYMFTAYCSEFRLAASGYSPGEAISKLKQTIISYCNALKRKDLLNRALEESKITTVALEVQREPEDVVIDIT